MRSFISTFVLLAFFLNPSKGLAAIGMQDCIDIDESKVVTKAPTCSSIDGSITGLIISGATAYSWKDDRGNVVGTTIDLFNVNAGVYQLTATNATTGCEKSTSLFSVPSGATSLPIYNVYGINAACDQNNGSFHIEIKNLTPPKKIRWTDEKGTTIGTDVDVYGLDIGTYNLYLTDNNGCEFLYKTATLKRILNITVDFQGAKITDDVCAQNLGSITNIGITDGLGPFVFKWTNELGQVVSNTLELINVPAGNYTIAITDACGRADLKKSFLIKNMDITLIPPQLSNFRLCVPGSITLNVDNPRVGIYRYYETENGIVPVFENTSPAFETKIDNNKDFYVSYGLGVCESPRTKVSVTLGISTDVIPNSFSPNGDGINDLWNLSWLSSYKNAVVMIYNRNGLLIYDYQRDRHLFDGYLKGKELAIGTYYYYIRPGEGCDHVSGTLTIIR